MAENERAYKVTVNLPTQEKGVILEIGSGVGAVENGHSKHVMLTKEDADSLRNSFGITVESSTKDKVGAVDLTEPQNPEAEQGFDADRAVEVVYEGGEK